MGHTRTRPTADRLCRVCGGGVWLIGGDLSLPEPLRKAVHEDGEETGPDGHVAAPIGPDPLTLP
jgi:hypothetical protein